MRQAVVQWACPVRKGGNAPPLFPATFFRRSCTYRTSYRFHADCMIEIPRRNPEGLGHDHRQRQQEGKTGRGMQKTKRFDVSGNGNRKKAVMRELSRNTFGNPKIMLDFGKDMCYTINVTQTRRTVPGTGCRQRDGTPGSGYNSYNKHFRKSETVVGYPFRLCPDLVETSVHPPSSAYRPTVTLLQ